MSELVHRYDFVLLFDVKDGNPNGDPDAGNLPRVDPETGHGLVTDVCLKRKIRNYVTIAKTGTPGYEIYVKEKAVLTAQQGRAYEALGLDGSAKTAAEPADDGDKPDKPEKKGRGKKEAGSGKKASDGEVVERARDWMCKTFFDIRAFGAVMSLKENNAGQVRGPVQFTFARSIDPIITAEHAITRMAVATQAEAEKQGGDNRTMGRKNTVPYGLYKAHGFISPAFAKQTGFTTDDLTVLWESIKHMFEHDRSAARGLMSLRDLIVFEHASALGNAPAHALFDKVKITRRDLSTPPRDYSAYEVTIDDLPNGVVRAST
ncbi:MAG: type I-C CRISPR-associated protein Cas7/Csd2 [Polyangiaceae bacterium]|nr:type I-C CRISPR-associated protein Cas7/Csd2 [Polyangiaceae bacterium]